MSLPSRSKRQTEGLKKRHIAVAGFLLLFVLFDLAGGDTFGSGDNSFDIDFVTIGDPVNAPATFGTPSLAGSVDYIYQIGKYEVSRDMVIRANAEGDLGITQHAMTNITGGPRPDMPAAGVSWNEAARFANWLNTSEGFSPAYKFATHPGDAGYRVSENILLWQAGDPGFDPANPFRNSLAHYVLPSVDEWFKAAFYDPNANDGAGGYWRYPTGSDTAPTPVKGGTDPGTAVYSQSQSQGPADITQVGGLSPYGVMGLGGNIFEWMETNSSRNNTSASSTRWTRGNNWFIYGSGDLSASSPRHDTDANSVGVTGVLGVRVGSIPEPPPLDAISLNGAGETYLQNFDEALGTDGGEVGRTFPTGWTRDGNVFANKTSTLFPVEAAFDPKSTFNAGAENDPDRALAIGVGSGSDQHFLQLLADVNEADATSFQMQFVIEAWDAKDGFYIPQVDRWTGLPDDPGEAAFNVTVDLDTGDGFMPLVDLGTVTTGARLLPVFEGIVDGHAEANRVSFDSGAISAAIPEGSQLRVRWEADTEAETNGWVFGLDNVSLSLFGTKAETGDFNGDGRLDVADLDALIAAVPNDTQFDLDGSGVFDTADRDVWITDIKNTFLGDTDLDGQVNSADLNTLALSWRRTDATSWAQGDFNGDGNVNSADLNTIGLNWRKTAAAQASTAPVPEPSTLLLTILGLVFLERRSKGT